MQLTITAIDLCIGQVSFYLPLAVIRCLSFVDARIQSKLGRNNLASKNLQSVHWISICFKEVVLGFLLLITDTTILPRSKLLSILALPNHT